MKAIAGRRVTRPGLDRLRDQVAQANFAVVLMTEPDRLARKYVHQVVLIEEFEKGGCQVAFADRPMSQAPTTNGSCRFAAWWPNMSAI
jgi:site-specific DNA recombinase